MTASTLEVTPAQRVRLLRAPAAMGVAGVAAVVALHLRDPHTSGSWGMCPFLFVTGQPCPGCGGLRAVNDLTHGDIGAALGSNAAAVALIAALAVGWVVWVARRAAGRSVGFVTIGRRPATIAMVAAVAFGVVRLLPWASGLQP